MIAGIKTFPTVDCSSAAYKKITFFSRKNHTQNVRTGKFMNTTKNFENLGHHAPSVKASNKASRDHANGYFHEVEKGELAPLRFCVYGAQSATRFFALDRRFGRLELASNRACFSHFEMSTEVSSGRRFCTSVTPLSDGVHSLVGTSSGEVFFFEDAQALQVFKIADNLKYGVMGLNVGDSVFWNLNNADNMPAGVKLKLEQSFMQQTLSGGKSWDEKSVFVSLSNGETVEVAEKVVYDEVVSSFASMKGPGAASSSGKYRILDANKTKAVFKQSD